MYRGRGMTIQCTARSARGYGALLGGWIETGDADLRSDGRRLGPIFQGDWVFDFTTVNRCLTVARDATSKSASARSA
jgi:hypothetical protein